MRNTSEPIKVGTILHGEHSRDAIHVAIAPVTVKDTLRPGTRCSIVDGFAVHDPFGCGIIDPFLKQSVYPYQQCWLFLDPYTITSLRHEWTHPAFDSNTEREMAEAWLRNYAETELSCEYKEMMHAASRFLRTGEYWCEGGRFEGCSFDEVFWTHFKTVTGESTSDDGSFFTCSC